MCKIIEVVKIKTRSYGDVEASKVVHLQGEEREFFTYDIDVEYPLNSGVFSDEKNENVSYQGEVHVLRSYKITDEPEDEVEFEIDGVKFGLGYMGSIYNNLVVLDPERQVC